MLAGASGGAFLALQQVMPKPIKHAAAAPIEPRALVLFSTLLDTTTSNFAKRFPDASTAKQLSPLRQLRRKLPPMMLCHGKSDRVTPYENARKFAKAMKWRGNRVELLEFENAEHCMQRCRQFVAQLCKEALLGLGRHGDRSQRLTEFGRALRDPVLEFAIRRPEVAHAALGDPLGLLACCALTYEAALEARHTRCGILGVGG